MNIKEFSTEFDILYNNIMSDMAPGLNEYEKSVFLTQAQESLVMDLYRGDNLDKGFENIEEYKRYLSDLTLSSKYTLSEDSTVANFKSSVITPPDDLLLITYESIESDSGCGGTLRVLPTTQDNLTHYTKNPFLGIRAKDALRLDIGGKIHILGDNLKGLTYNMVYIRKPYPIILEDLSLEGLSVGGEYLPLSATECSELPPILHRQILLNAVQIAKSVWKS